MLRNVKKLEGLAIGATDGPIGKVSDSTWSIRYLIANTSNWGMGHQVLLSPEWIQDVSWLESVVNIDLDREVIKDSPAYDVDAPLGRESERALYGHYGRKHYWRDLQARAVA